MSQTPPISTQMLNIAARNRNKVSITAGLLVFAFLKGAVQPAIDAGQEHMQTFQKQCQVDYYNPERRMNQFCPELDGVSEVEMDGLLHDYDENVRDQYRNLGIALPER